MMRRWLAIVLLILVPLQVSYAAWHEYADHDAADMGQALFHSYEAQDHNHDAGTSPNPHDHGLGHIHLDHAQLVSAPFVLAAGSFADARITLETGPYPSLVLERLDRPPLSARR